MVLYKQLRFFPLFVRQRQPLQQSYIFPTFPHSPNMCFNDPMGASIQVTRGLGYVSIHLVPQRNMPGTILLRPVHQLQVLSARIHH